MKVIDIHIHGGGGYDTQTVDPGDLLRIAEIQASRGVSAIIPTIYPAKINKMRTHIEAVKKAMEIQAREESHGSKILGVNLEGPFLNPSFPGALDPQVFLPPAERHYREITEGFENIIKVVTISPELKGALALTRLLSDRGVAVSLGHTNATFSEAERAYQQGAHCITHLFNAMRPYHHREPGIAGFGLLNPHIYVELIGDQFHLHPRTLDLVFRVKNPSKIIIVSDSVKETPDHESPTTANLENGTGKLMGGAIDVVTAATKLIKAGFNRELILPCISFNPERYLSS
ncbi:MAG: hypothetical protein LBQ00_07330 [Syntrophobacterales bacterium]|jgi:N-acetylglucosamine-6-phosphate deacetylase|nr:hypothetical protein [Syntrophobacterales bacterium]